MGATAGSNRAAASDRPCLNAPEHRPRHGPARRHARCPSADRAARSSVVWRQQHPVLLVAQRGGVLRRLKRRRPPQGAATTEVSAVVPFHGAFPCSQNWDELDHLGRQGWRRASRRLEQGADPAACGPWNAASTLHGQPARMSQVSRPGAAHIKLWRPPCWTYASCCLWLSGLSMGLRLAASPVHRQHAFLQIKCLMEWL